MITWDPLTEKFADTKPRKILALDGGGIRGVITLEILLEIETQLRNKLGNPNLTLSDYFDYIGGTSTGAIIAAGMALGKSVEEMLNFYDQYGAQMFDHAFLLDR